MGRTADLQAFKAGVGFVERDPKVRAKPRVGPKLQTGFQPFHLGEGFQQDLSDYERLKEAGVFADIEAAGRRPEDPEGPEGLGLSMARNSRRPLRHGFQGLTAPGRHCVSSALSLLEERRDLLSFWTVTLPDDALRHLARVDGLPRFTDRLLERLRRTLERRLGVALYVGVAELQPKRTRAVGYPCPHLHVVFQGRAHRRASWLISPGELDGFIAAALKQTGFDVNGPLISAGNVQRVKRSVRAYLSKYMTKGSSDARLWEGGLWQNLIPRQWWCWSQACRQLVESCTTDLPTGFLAWVWRHRQQLLEAGSFYLQQCTVPQDAPATYRIYWGTVGKLARLMAQWHEHLEDALISARRELGIYTQMGQLIYAKPLAR